MRSCFWKAQFEGFFFIIIINVINMQISPWWDNKVSFFFFMNGYKAVDADKIGTKCRNYSQCKFSQWVFCLEWMWGRSVKTLVIKPWDSQSSNSRGKTRDESFFQHPQIPTWRHAHSGTTEGLPGGVLSQLLSGAMTRRPRETGFSSGLKSWWDCETAPEPLPFRIRPGWYPFPCGDTIFISIFAP